MKTKIKLEVPLPISMDLLQKGIRFTIVQMTLKELNNVDMSILAIENFDKHEIYGQCKYTRKVLNLSKKIPGIIKLLISKKAYLIEEESYDAFPLCTTFFKSKYFKEENFQIKTVTACADYTHSTDHIDIYEQHHYDDKESYIPLVRVDDNKVLFTREIEITVNCFGESKIIKEIKKSMTALFLKKCRLLIQNIEKYRHLTEVDMEKLENELLKKLKFFT